MWSVSGDSGNTTPKLVSCTSCNSPDKDGPVATTVVGDGDGEEHVPVAASCLSSSSSSRSAAAASLEIHHLQGSPERAAVSWTVACSLTSLLGMNCKSRAEAFARSLQSRLRHLGTAGVETETDAGAEAAGGDAVCPTCPEAPRTCSGGCPVTLGLASDTGRLLFVRRQEEGDAEKADDAGGGGGGGNSVELDSAQSATDSDAGYYDYDIGSPLSPDDGNGNANQPSLINRSDDLSSSRITRPGAEEEDNDDEYEDGGGGGEEEAEENDDEEERKREEGGDGCRAGGKDAGSGSDGGESESGCALSTTPEVDGDGWQDELSVTETDVVVGGGGGGGCGEGEGPASDDTSESSVSHYFDASDDFFVFPAKFTKSNVYDAYNGPLEEKTAFSPMTPPTVVIEAPRRSSRGRLSDAAETSPAQLKTFEELCRRSREKSRSVEREVGGGGGGDDADGGGGSVGGGNDDKLKRLRRSSSLKSGKTPPGTPGRKKIVRFADVMGLDLAEIRSFLDGIPNVPKSAYSDLDAAVCAANGEGGTGGGGGGFVCDFTSSVVVVGGGGSSVAGPGAVHPLPPHLQLLVTSAPRHPAAGIGSSSCVLVPLFQQPGTVFGFLDRIRDHQVALESAVERDMAVDGVVRVHNIAYHKSVLVRYTVDDWKTSRDLHASYCDGSCDGFSDKFSFTIYAHWLREGQRVVFAVCFQANGVQYWDNNWGNNYMFQCYAGPVPAPVGTVGAGPAPAPAPALASSSEDTWLRHEGHF